MSHRQLHPREESYRWAIERLDEVFGAERVHVIAVSVSRGPGSRPEEITLRTPTQDLNKQADRQEVLENWISEVQKRFKTKTKTSA